MEGHEKGNCRFRIQMSNLSVGKGRAPEVPRKDTAPSDSCMEVGYDYYGFCYRASENSETTRCHMGDSG